MASSSDEEMAEVFSKPLKPSPKKKLKGPASSTATSSSSAAGSSTAGPSSSSSSSSSTADTLPWVEKYRPKEFSELIAHDDIISTLQRLIEKNQLPHLLLYGPPGTGKTSTILACARQMYKSHFQSMVLELNASDDRGIDVVREQIKDFASTKTIFSAGIKLVILDEADNMTHAAQAALRRIIEKYTKSTRFCLICNYPSKLIPALHSRCTRFRFGPLPKDAVISRLKHVIQAEGLQGRIDQKGLDALVRLGEGDMRKSLNILQSTAMAYATITADDIYQCTGTPRPQDIQEVVEWLLNEEFTTAYQNVLQMKTEKGLALQDIVRDIHSFVMRLSLSAHTTMTLLRDLADIEARLLTAATERVQLSALVGTFQIVREIEATE